MFKPVTTLSALMLVAAFPPPSHADATATPPSRARVDAIFSAWNRTDSPGCALAIMHHGHIVYEHGYGMADLSHEAIITPQTPFHVASVSKQFTSAAILLLIAQGKLSLDDEIHRYLPALPDFGAPILIRHLLHQSSGLRDQWDLLDMDGYRLGFDLITDEDIMRLVQRQHELNFPPGSQYRYSNTNATLLGHIVSQVSAQSLRQFTDQALFGPLGMTHTHFRDDHAEINKGEAIGYERAADGSFRLSVTNFDTVGATSLYTTVEDLARWDENFYAPKVVGADFSSQMTALDPFPSGKRPFYGLGLMVLSYRDAPVIDHAGADAGFRSDLLRFPQQHLSVACLCNTPPAQGVSALTRQVADLYATGLHAARAPFNWGGPLPMRSVWHAREASGFYRSEVTGVVVQLAEHDGALQVLHGGENQTLLSDEAGHFVFPESIDARHFEPARGRPTRMVVAGEGKPTEIWNRLPPYAAPGFALEDTVGRYYSDELDATYAVELHAGAIRLSRSKHPPEALTAAGPDLFVGSIGTIEFLRDAQHHVRGLQASTERVTQLKFVRVD